MYSNHWHSRTFSFAISAMLTSAVLATAPNPSLITAGAVDLPELLIKVGYTGPVPPTSPIPEPTAVPVKLPAQTPPLITPVQIETLREAIFGPNGGPGEVTVELLRIHSVSDASQDTKLPSFSIVMKKTGDEYQISLLPKSLGYLISRKSSQELRVFRLGQDFSFVSASKGVDAAHPRLISRSEADPMYIQDLRTWAVVADKLGANLVAAAR